MDVATRIGVVLAFVGTGATIVALFAPYEWRNMPAWTRRTGLFGGAILMVIGVLLIFLLPHETFPDVRILFVQSDKPALVLENISTSKPAREIKYGGFLTNLSGDDPRKPLPIPFESFDFLRPSGKSALEPIFERPMVAPLIKNGDEIFGYVSVSCPECERERVYWVYVKWPDSGWSSELPQGQSVNTKWLYDALPELKKNSAILGNIANKKAFEKVK
jgi:hypothetical protein